MTSTRLITPRTLKGFRDYLPEVAIPREAMMQTARRTFAGFGFAPIDTPVLEYLEILTGKGSEETDRQIYQFKTAGGREVAMRFDLTVPLARFVAQHVDAVGLPFKRYQIAPVWRGENPQKGRYREFVQCDFDTVGTTSVVADIETLVVVNDLLTALGIDRFTLSINNRGLLAGMLASLDLTSRLTDVLRSLDKLAKIGRSACEAEMIASAGLSAGQARSVLDFAATDTTLDPDGSWKQRLLSQVGNQPDAVAAIDRLDQTHRGALAAGVEPERLRIDVSIARGLDYYTGLIFETTLDELPGFGSVCSGGRYDNLAGLYTKRHLPGIGGSLGLDRLVAALESLGRLPSAKKPCRVMIAFFDENQIENYLRLASWLRGHGVGCELYPEPIKLGKQIQYAVSGGFDYALIAGSREWAAGTIQVKDLAEKTSVDVRWDGEDGTELLAKLAGKF